MKKEHPIIADFIKIIKESMPGNQNLAFFLMDILPIGREAVYRRIRGEVPFTMPEMAIIADRLNLSIDNLIDNKNINKIPFNLDLINDSFSLNGFVEILERQKFHLESFQKNKHISLKAAFNSIPYSFLLEYSTITKFQIYKYIYQVSPSPNIGTLSDYKISNEINTMQREWLKAMRKLDSFQYILDKRLFIYVAEDIAQFYRMKLISAEEKELLKDEILIFLSDLEEMAVTGISKMTGKQIEIFLSHIHFDTSYIYYESEDMEIAHFRLFTINGIRSNNNKICEKQKKILESLLHSSTRITLSNALFRKQFFKDQHKEISKILK